MLFENFENIVSLLCTIVGLLYCVFKYVESNKRGYRFIIAFFLANFLSEYYWTMYELITNSYPDVSEFVAYLGWNIAFFCLLVADTYGAMTSKRSYRDVLSREKVIEEIKNGSGSQFDPKFTEIMLKLIEDDTEYLMRENREN